MKTAVLYYQSNVDQFLRDKPDVEEIYSLSPDAKTALLGKTDVTMLTLIQFDADNFSFFPERTESENKAKSIFTNTIATDDEYKK